MPTPQQVSGTTVDRLVIIFAITAGATIIIATLGTMIMAYADAEWDAQPVITAIDAQVSVIVGGLVGLLAGQASARAERQRQDAADAAAAADPPRLRRERP